MLTGGCFCGQVRYEADGTPYNETICHCADCRRVVGAHAVAFFTIKRAGVRWTGTPSSFSSSPGITRRFCGTCSTSLTWESEEKPDELDVTIASLDDPSLVRPKDHVYAASRAAWDAICDGLPAYEHRRTGP
ncbi:MAG: GFA family protein [Acetobacteraceae bacterium]|nr:GFA family protein [Acetobacteraceae bacterium]